MDDFRWKFAIFKVSALAIALIVLGVYIFVPGGKVDKYRSYGFETVDSGMPIAGDIEIATDFMWDNIDESIMNFTGKDSPFEEYGEIEFKEDVILKVVLGNDEIKSVEGKIARLSDSGYCYIWLDLPLRKDDRLFKIHCSHINDIEKN